MPMRVLGLTTRVHHPPQSWLGHGQTRQLPQRDDELGISYVALGRCTGLAILKYAGIQCSHGDPKYRSGRTNGRCRASRRGS